MYRNLNSVANPCSIQKEKTPELDYIINRLESESSRFFNLANELIRKSEFISRLRGEEPEQSQNKPAEPDDFVSKAHYQINQIARQNDKLQSLVNHFETLV